jgi:hypothetical protein
MNEATRVGREPIAIVELLADYCEHVYGEAPCSASGDPGEECFNTRKTCQDLPNYSIGRFAYRFVQPRSEYDVGQLAFDDTGLEGSITIPCLRSVGIQPTELKPGFGLSTRGRVAITLQDFPHHDRGIDPYVASRDYDPSTRGTFWRKWIARNPYYSGRVLKVYTGYLTDPFDLGEFESRTYLIESFSGPDSRGNVQIVARDVLGMIDSEKAVAPKPSRGVLSADITAIDASATLLPSGIGDLDYPSSGTVRIGSECIAFTRSGDVLTLTSRGTDGTEKASHSEGDSVQVCRRYTDQRIDDVVREMLVDDAGMPSEYIDAVEWAYQVDTFLPGHLVTALITEPTGIRKLIDEICRVFLLDVWGDEVDDKVRLKALAPPEDLPDLLTDEANLIAGSLTQKDVSDKRRSQVWVFYGQRDPTRGLEDDSNYSTVYIAIDADAESPAEYDESRIEKIYSRWYSTAADAQRAGVRMRARLRDTPKEIEGMLDAKDLAYRTGGCVRLLTDQIVDETGAPKEITVKITRQQWRQQGHTLAITAIDESFYGRYARMTPDTMDDYSDASDEDRSFYGFIAEDSEPFFPDGTEGYKVV